MAPPSQSDSNGRHVRFAEPVALPPSNASFSRSYPSHLTSSNAAVRCPSTLRTSFVPEGTALSRETPQPSPPPNRKADSSTPKLPQELGSPPATKDSGNKPGSKKIRWKEDRRTFGMAEPRARAARHKGHLNFSSELRLLLLAYGDPSPHPSFPAEPLPETIRVLDEIVTDFVLEMCHSAAAFAANSRRQKIKVDDFRFALRRDPAKLGRVQELLRMERELKEARKIFDQNDDQLGSLKETGKRGLEELGESVDGTGLGGVKKSRGKGKRGAQRGSDATDVTAPKRRKTTT